MYVLARCTLRCGDVEMWTEWRGVKMPRKAAMTLVAQIPLHSVCSDWKYHASNCQAEGPSKMPIWAFKTPHLQWPHRGSRSIPTSPSGDRTTSEQWDLGISFTPYPRIFRYQFLSHCLTTGMQDRRFWGHKPRASQKPQYQKHLAPAPH
jgi:hypothetical protein